MNMSAETQPSSAIFDACGWSWSWREYSAIALRNSACPAVFFLGGGASLAHGAGRIEPRAQAGPLRMTSVRFHVTISRSPGTRSTGFAHSGR